MKGNNSRKNTKTVGLKKDVNGSNSIANIYLTEVKIKKQFKK